VTAGALGRIYKDGEIIVRHGDIAECMYVIQEGRAEVVVERDGREVRLRIAEPGEIIGEMAVFEREVRSATVRALGEARVLTVDKKNFLRRIHEDPTMAFRLVEMMSRRIRELSDEVARLKKSD
jgi:CRP/FNR family cyclic AMP-dependent transcriptional regulator